MIQKYRPHHNEAARAAAVPMYTSIALPAMKKNLLALLVMPFFCQALLADPAPGEVQTRPAETKAKTAESLPKPTETKPATATPVPKDYVLGPGDVIEISVWKEDALTKQVLLRPDGGITFPLIGDLQASGLTVSQLTDEITKRLSNYVSEPAVNISVITVNQKIYVLGKVNRPGEFVIPTRVDVMQALAMAGGLTTFADEDDITIIRRENGRVVSFNFDYKEVSNGEALEQNILLQRGDVVVVH